MNRTFSHLVTCFFNAYLVNERKLSKNTVASYSDCMRLLIEYACKRFHLQPEKIGIEMFSREFIVEFLEQLEKERKNDAQTTNQRLAAIKTFFHFLARNVPELMEANELIQAIRPKKTDHQPPPSLTIDEVRAILAIPDSSELMGARDKALLYTLYNTGARVQELANLTISDLHFDTPATVVLTGKGKKKRTIPLWPETVQHIEHYLELRTTKHIHSEHLFLNTEKKPITRFGIGRRVQRHVQSAARKCPSLLHRSISPHVFRHATALHLIEAGNDITIVKDWLGHADLKTTSQYVEVSVKRKQEALEKLPPPNEQPETPKWKQPSIIELLSCLSRRAHYVA